MIRGQPGNKAIDHNYARRQDKRRTILRRTSSNPDSQRDYNIFLQFWSNFVALLKNNGITFEVVMPCKKRILSLLFKNTKTI